MSSSGQAVQPPRLAASLSSLPHEVIVLICTFAHSTGGLLHLSVTSRLFYRLLRTRSKRIERLWYDAILRSPGEKTMMHDWALKSPNLSDDLEKYGMSVVEYVALVYGRFCQVCGKESDRDRIVFFHELRLRCCARCARRNIQTGEDITDNYPSIPLNAFLCSRATTCNPLTFKFTGKMYSLSFDNEDDDDDDIVIVENGVETRIPSTEGPKPSDQFPHPCEWYYLPEVLAHAAVLAALQRVDPSADQGATTAYRKMRSRRVKTERRLLEDLMERARRQ
ncbi:hypothetical protein JCM6882_008654 [Rhodosporidiobolus microsporus]